MKQIILDKDNSSSEFLYEQLYDDIKRQIMVGEMIQDEKCPSIRSLSEITGVSVTTVMQAYNQLLAEGFIRNKPGSGYYVEHVGAIGIDDDSERSTGSHLESAYESEYAAVIESGKPKYFVDEDSFDFIKWKKCAAKIYTEYSKSLLYESDLKGEPALRNEISKYLFQSRGVSADSENIIIAAGTQQIAFHLGRVLKAINVSLISLESPGYTPVKSMFEDASFTTTDISVTEDGISISHLPVNISSAAYVNPSNQFPTGVVMPASRRFEILKWADDNKSYVIEDDYNSELRYFGKPMPTIKSLDVNDRVIYLGSFSSTLFPAIKISYMVLPDSLSKVFDGIKKNYSQTCSKAEQLTLAYYMKEGHYYTAIKKKRALYAKKLQVVEKAFSEHGDENITLENTNSGLTVIIKINSVVPGEFLASAAAGQKINVSFINEISNEEQKKIAFYYSSIPLSEIENVVESMIYCWKKIR